MSDAIADGAIPKNEAYTIACDLFKKMESSPQSYSSMFGEVRVYTEEHANPNPTERTVDDDPVCTGEQTIEDTSTVFVIPHPHPHPHPNPSPTERTFEDASSAAVSTGSTSRAEPFEPPTSILGWLDTSVKQGFGTKYVPTTSLSLATNS
jgi:hypothetical protein